LIKRNKTKQEAKKKHQKRNNNKIIPKKQKIKLNKTTKLNIQTELVSSIENKGRDN
jgi:hypothetical protein